MYVDRIIVNLRKLGLGCRMHNCFVGCLVYADDLLLISASLLDLQTMLDTCSITGEELGIKYNASKSKCIAIGPHLKPDFATMSISNMPMQWVDKVK